MLKPPKQVSRRHELREDKVITAYARTLTLAEKYRTALIVAAVATVVVFLGVLGWVYWQADQAEEAEELLGTVLPLYEAGEYEQALEGTSEAAGLLEVADEYGSSDAGNLARFYAASALFQLERYDEAAEYFSEYDGEGVLEASALAGEAAVYEMQGEHADAARLYERAAETYESAATAPDYYLDAARNYEAAGDLAAAREVYETLQEAYPDSQAAGLVPVNLARLEAMLASGE
ncbi:MAG: tetratricopeptide repeat protein [Rhodothermales bacterium]|nr:tetratricopeptide repeat protein [Rhodothermales bacterium]